MTVNQYLRLLEELEQVNRRIDETNQRIDETNPRLLRMQIPQCHVDGGCEGGIRERRRMVGARERSGIAGIDRP